MFISSKLIVCLLSKILQLRHGPAYFSLPQLQYTVLLIQITNSKVVDLFIYPLSYISICLVCFDILLGIYVFIRIILSSC
jgi:hypothetical protein